MSPWVQGLRSASVGAEQTSPGCLAVSAPLRSLQNRRPPDVLQPIFRKASVVAGQAPMVQGLASGSVGSWHEVPRTSLGLRFASVGAEQTSPGRLAVSAPLRSAQSRHPPDVLRSPLRSGRRRTDIPRMSCAPSSARLRLLRGRFSIMISQER